MADDHVHSYVPIEVGKTYTFTHTRKGKFTGKLLKFSEDGDWADIEITKGTTKTMLPENERGPGEAVSMRMALITHVTEPES